MASSFPNLDQPPPQPPDVAGPMGAGPGAPYGGVSSMLAQKQGGAEGGGPPSQVNPKGALIAQSEAIKKVLDGMAKAEPGFGPFADRIRSLLDAGIGSVVSAGGQPGASGGKPPQMQGPASMRPEAPGGSFPG